MLYLFSIFICILLITFGLDSDLTLVITCCLVLSEYPELNNYLATIKPDMTQKKIFFFSQNQ